MSSSGSNQLKANTAKQKKDVKLTSLVSETSHDAIRARAYAIYESNGHQDHNEERDWLRAEEELRASGKLR